MNLPRYPFIVWKKNHPISLVHSIIILCCYSTFHLEKLKLFLLVTTKQFSSKISNGNMGYMCPIADHLSPETGS